MPRVPSPTTASVAPARRCAYTVLRRVFEQGAYADRALTAEAARLEPRDRALAMRLAYGAVQRRGTLDHLIEQLSERPVAAIDPPLLAALRLGLLRAALHARSPRLRRRRRRRRARQGARPRRARPRQRRPAPRHARGRRRAARRARRRHARARRDQALPPRVDRAAVVGGARARAGTRADGVRQRAAARSRCARTRSSATPLRSPASCPCARISIPRDPRGGGPRGAVRRAQLQRVGSAALSTRSRARRCASPTCSAPADGERVLDLCAAPGGKTTHLAALMHDRGEVLAVERDKRRAGSLARTAQRLHASSVRVEVADAEHWTEAARGADARGLRPRARRSAVLGARNAAGARRPALARRRRTRSPRWRARRHGSSAPAPRALRPGGVLVYSTCTISPIENERLIAAFLDSHANFALEDVVLDAATSRPHGRLLHRPHAQELSMEGNPETPSKAADRPRAAVPELRRAVAAPDQPARPLSLRVLPAPLRAHLGVPQLRRALDDRADVLDRDPQVQRVRRLDAAGRMSERARELLHDVRVAPSILSADFGRLREQVSEVLAAGARRDPRGRDGRALRAADHRRPAGRRGAAQRRCTTPGRCSRRT